MRGRRSGSSGTFVLYTPDLMKLQVKKPNGVKSGGAWRPVFLCSSAYPRVIEVVTHVNKMRSFLKCKMRNSPNSCPWYVELVI
jgi:hypothetical protein